MNVLMISDCPTHPTNAGNRWAILSTCEVLKQLGCDVHFLYIEERTIRSSNMAMYDEWSNCTAKYWGECFHIYQYSRIQQVYRSLLARYRRVICNFHSGLYDRYPYRLDRMVNRLDAKYHFDVCIVNYVYMTKLFDYINIPKKAVLTHDALAYKNLACQQKCSWIDAHQEATALQKCTDIFALQDDEHAYFHILSPHSNIYNIYSKYDYHSQPIMGNKNLLFLSGNNGYNQNGLKWFIDGVFPLIRVKHPDAKLLIAGGICNSVKGLYENIDGVELKGFVENPRDFYALGDVAINPTYQGTGLKIKTFEAIANDKVTLVHPHSMIGVYKKESAPLFASNKPEEWVAYLDSIWDYPEKIQQIKKQNQSYLEDMNNFIINEYKRFLEY